MCGTPLRAHGAGRVPISLGRDARKTCLSLQRKGGHRHLWGLKLNASDRSGASFLVLLVILCFDAVARTEQLPSDLIFELLFTFFLNQTRSN